MCGISYILMGLYLNMNVFLNFVFQNSEYVFKCTFFFLASLLQRRANSLRAPSNGSGESRPATPITEQSLLSSSCPTPTLSQMVKRKSRTSSEYDINNIVIPYSISSSTRLEKPQYKEILTPKWRLIEGEHDDIQSTEMVPLVS